MLENCHPHQNKHSTFLLTRIFFFVDVEVMSFFNRSVSEYESAALFPSYLVLKSSLVSISGEEVLREILSSRLTMLPKKGVLSSWHLVSISGEEVW